MFSLVLTLGISLATPLPPAVIDGDTVRRGDEKIRIANIDAPETRRAGCDAERRLGVIAKRRLADLLAGGEVVIIRGDPVDGRLSDWFGRTLATIEVDGFDVGAILIAENLARPWTGRRASWCEAPGS